MGAQRLSASRIISGVHHRLRSRRPDQVLNAFRHHGLYRFVMGRRTFCAQRPPIISAGGHLLGQPLTHAECSTPFGITDYIGRRSPARAAPHACRVLNAFRHHGLYRSLYRRLVWTWGQICAQRLSASRIISAAAPDRGATRRFSVLNAFRHHGLYRLNLGVVGTSSRDPMCSTPFGITDYIGLMTTSRTP